MSNNKDFKVKNGIQPTVYHEGLGTVVSGSEGYSIGSASYDSKSFSVAGQTTNPYGLRMSADGTRVIVLDRVDSNLVQYNLSTAYDITTAVAQGSEFSLSTQTTSPMGITVSNSGAKVYVSTETSPDNIYQYDLSTAWDVSTASYSGNLFSPQTQAASSSGIFVKEDGTKLYVRDITTDAVYQYTMSTPYDISTASYDSKSLSVSGQSSNGYGITFSVDGLRFYITDVNGNIYQYDLSTAWDISTGAYSSIFFSVTSQESTALGLEFSNSGQKMYIVGQGNDTIYQYSTVLTTNALDLSTGSVFEVTPTSDVQVTLSNPAASGTVSGATLLLDGGGSAGYDLGNGSYSGKSFDVSSQDTTPLGLSFNDTGTKLYVAGAANDSIFQYSLSTAYDISTASYDSVSFSVASQAGAAQAVSFKTDGTKMYVLDDTPNNSVHQYSLSTAYDLSTASYDSVSFSVASQEGGPLGLFIKPDGTKFYVCGTGSDTVFQYSMSTAWDMSTASYDSVSFSVASQDSRPNGIFFKPTGDVMYISGQGSDAIFEYSLSTAWNVSTASYTSTSLDVTGEALNPQDLVMSSDGKTLFVITSETDTVYQYSTATPATITYDTAIEWPGGTAPTSPPIGETDVVTFNTRDGGSTYQGVLAIDGAK